MFTSYEILSIYSCDKILCKDEGHLNEECFGDCGKGCMNSQGCGFWDQNFCCLCKNYDELDSCDKVDLMEKLLEIVFNEYKDFRRKKITKIL